MTRGEVEILLKTVYKGEGAQKALSDMDKISASGQKVAGAMKIASKDAALVFAGASASTMARNPQLFANISKQASVTFRGNQRQSIPFVGGGVPPVIPPPQPPSGGGAQGGGVGPFTSRFAMGFGLGRAAMIGGIAGVAGAVAAMAVRAAFNALLKSVKALAGAFDDARKLYAKALTSGGLNLGFVSKREALAEVIGVSSKEVYQFGQAVLFLSNRLQYATTNVAKLTPDLTATSYQFKILEINLKSLFATMAYQAGPSLRIFADGLAKFTNAFSQFLQKDPIALLIQQFAKGISGLNGIEAIGSLLGGKDSGAAPPPISYMKQIQASAWERMGLIVGGIGGANPAQETARNTKVTADGVKQLVRMGAGQTHLYDPFYGPQSYE